MNYLKTVGENKGLKFLKITAIGFLLLFVFVALFFRYRNYSSYKQFVHADADVVIKVNIDQIFKKNIFEYLFNKPNTKKKIL